MGMLKSAKIEAFCYNYVVNGGKGTPAVLAAGYSDKGAAVQASRLLKNPNVLTRIDELRKPTEIKLDLSKEKLVARLMQFVFTDVRQFYDEFGNLIPIHELTDDAAACLAGFEIEAIKFDGMEIGSLKKIKRIDPVKAAELIAGIMGYKAPDKKLIVTQKVPVINW